MSVRKALLLFACVVLAARLLLIATLGDAMPMGDQWPEEGEMFAKILQGRMPVADLFASHYEHRYVVTRLWDIAIWQLDNRIWNPPLQMVLNAGLMVLFLVLLLYWLRPLLAATAWGALLAFAALLFCLPFDYENTLNSFQSQIYFDFLFSLMFLHGMVRQASLSPRWWLALGCGLLAWLSHAAGTATLLAGAGFLLWRLWRLPEPHGRDQAAALLLVLLAATAVLATPASPPVYSVDSTAGVSHVVQLAPRVDSPGEFLRALFTIASWPGIFFAPLFYLPLLRFLWWQWRRPLPAGSPAWFVVALGLWVLALLAMMAYGRGKLPVISRYTDFYALGLLLNFLCLLLPAGAAVRPRWQRLLTPVWLLVLLSSLLPHTAAEISGRVNLWLPQAHAVATQARLYLDSGDPSALAENPFPQLPLVPSAPELRQMLDVAEVREVLPPLLVPAHGDREPAWVVLLLGNLQTLALLLLTLGLGAALLDWLRPAPREKRDAAS